ncbi:hypothetical protein C8J56DRAFT_1048882 [Mycena floridula]|nr:hypothetical protein C8J56DRAFT_1048882 [Mycena floridula]
MAIDVDCKAIQALEEAMFTDSANAGKAGYQWGLNAGPHQEGWKPWHDMGLPVAGVMMNHDAHLLEECDPEVQQPEDSLNREEAGDDYADKYVPKGKLKHQTSLKQSLRKLTHLRLQDEELKAILPWLSLDTEILLHLPVPLLLPRHSFSLHNTDSLIYDSSRMDGPASIAL